MSTQAASSRLDNLRFAKFPHDKDDRHWQFVLDECARLRIDPTSVAVKMEVNEHTGEVEPQIIITLQGMRDIAGKSGKYDGETSPQFCGADGKWVDVWLDDEWPRAARATVMRKDFDLPFEGKAYFNQSASYRIDESGMPRLTRSWEIGAAPMLGKCALVAAYRMAYHAEIANLTAVEENEPGSLSKFSRSGWTDTPAASAPTIADDPKSAWRLVDDSTPDTLRGLRLALMDKMDSTAAADDAIENYRRQLPILFGAHFTAFAAVVLRAVLRASVSV